MSRDIALKALREVKEYFVNYEELDPFRLAKMLMRVDQAIYALEAEVKVRYGA